MDNYAKVDLYQTQAQRTRDQANAATDECVRALMLQLADEYEELATIHLAIGKSQ